MRNKIFIPRKCNITTQIIVKQYGRLQNRHANANAGCLMNEDHTSNNNMTSIEIVSIFELLI